MRKSEQFSVAIFLAVALFAGTIAGSSAPAFVVDAQATEEKKYYKEKERHSDNRDGRDGHDNRDGRDGHDNRDGRDGHDGDKSSVKYIKCNNVNINGKERNSHGGNNNWPGMGGGNEWTNGGGNEWPRDGGNEWPRGGDNHNVPGFVKETDKDVVVICIFNNDGKKKVVPVEPETCEECFLTIQQGGFLPRGQLMQIENALEELGTDIESVCERLGLANPETVTLAQIEAFVETLTNNPNVVENLSECLFEFVGDLRENTIL